MFAAHQIGTHRMGIDAATSVVDANLRTHDISNLYLVGSGCFVTASTSPPTLTIAALAIRAAEHIAADLRPHARAAPRADSGHTPGTAPEARRVLGVAVASQTVGRAVSRQH
jgi:choline dehydrogenase-like flavoprotein